MQLAKSFMQHIPEWDSEAETVKDSVSLSC